MVWERKAARLAGKARKSVIAEFGSRRIFIAFLLVLSIAAVLRFWALTSLGLSHPDAGNYIRMSTWMIGDYGRPMYWEPPVYPIIISLAFLVFGIADYVALGVTALFGVLLVGVVFFIGKEIYDPQTGVVASLFAAVTEYLIIYSRDVVVDGVFTFFFSLAFLFFIKGLIRKRYRHYLLFGFFAGITMLTKYFGFMVYAVCAIFLILFHGRRILMGKPASKAARDVKGMALALAVISAMQIPWITAIGIGYYASGSGAGYFSLGDVSINSVASNLPKVMNSGFHLFLSEIDKQRNLTGGLDPSSGYLYYLYPAAFLISPLVIAAFLIGVGRSASMMKAAQVALLAWFILVAAFITFVLDFKSTRIFLVCIPPLLIFAARGALGIRRKEMAFAAIAVISLSGLLLSADSLGRTHSGFKGAGEYLHSNVREGELIFNTGMPTVLFYHEIDTGNWWRNGDFSETPAIRYVLVEYHAYIKRDVIGYFDLERFERDFVPAQTFREDDPIIEMELLAKGIDVSRLGIIKIYKVDRDISGYFNPGWSS